MPFYCPAYASFSAWMVLICSAALTGVATDGSVATMVFINGIGSQEPAGAKAITKLMALKGTISPSITYRPPIVFADTTAGSLVLPPDPPYVLKIIH